MKTAIIPHVEEGDRQDCPNWQRTALQRRTGMKYEELNHAEQVHTPPLQLRPQAHGSRGYTGVCWPGNTSYRRAYQGQLRPFRWGDLRSSGIRFVLSQLITMMLKSKKTCKLLGVSGTESKGSDGMEAQGYKAQK